MELWTVKIVHQVMHLRFSGLVVPGEVAMSRRVKCDVFASRNPSEIGFGGQVRPLINELPNVFRARELCGSLGTV